MKFKVGDLVTTSYAKVYDKKFGIIVKIEDHFNFPYRIYHSNDSMFYLYSEHELQLIQE